MMSVIQKRAILTRWDSKQHTHPATRLFIFHISQAVNAPDVAYPIGVAYRGYGMVFLDGR